MREPEIPQKLKNHLCTGLSKMKKVIKKHLFMCEFQSSNHQRSLKYLYAVPSSFLEHSCHYLCKFLMLLLLRCPLTLSAFTIVNIWQLFPLTASRINMARCRPLAQNLASAKLFNMYFVRKLLVKFASLISFPNSEISFKPGAMIFDELHSARDICFI